jgi:hypothetical protein
MHSLSIVFLEAIPEHFARSSLVVGCYLWVDMHANIKKQNNDT